MLRYHPACSKFLVFAVLCSLLSQSDRSLIFPQEIKDQKPADIRVGVALVQTDVMVYDRENRFVDNMRAAQFEFRVDGRVQPISFFDIVNAGTPHDQEIWAKAPRKTPPPQPPQPQQPVRQGRTILFFVDDWHLSAESMTKAKAALMNLIDQSLGPDDQAAIVTASGQLGFLQQFTNNKSVLAAATTKLSGGSIVEDLAWPPMNEAQAARIVQGDSNLETYYTNAMIPRIGEQVNPRRIIRDRALSLAQVSAGVTQRTLSALGDFVRFASSLPGRKLIFFLSDGFALQLSMGQVADHLWRLATAAANAGAVIYSLDTRGLQSGNRDLRSSLPGDRDSNLAQSSYNAVLDFQDGLNSLAADTGGRFLKNTNDFASAISTAMAESSRYYLLGWYVDQDALKPGKYWSLHVSVKDRPDLKVSLRNGLVDLSQCVPIQQNQRKAIVDAKEASDQLIRALNAPFRFDDLRVSVHAGWVAEQNGEPALAVSYQIDIDSAVNGSDIKADVRGGVANKDGIMVESFSETLSRSVNANPPPMSGKAALRYARILHLQPGIYEVRIAARNPLSGDIGTAEQWIEIPDKQSGTMRLSSIFLREVTNSKVTLDVESLKNCRFNIPRRFAGKSAVYFLLNVYDPAERDLLVQARIYSGNQPVVQPAPQPIAGSDPNMNQHLIPVVGGLNFDDLAPGDYILEIAVTEPLSNTKVVERVRFVIEQNHIGV